MSKRYYVDFSEIDEESAMSVFYKFIKDYDCDCNEEVGYTLCLIENDMDKRIVYIRHCGSEKKIYQRRCINFEPIGKTFVNVTGEYKNMHISLSDLVNDIIEKVYK